MALRMSSKKSTPLSFDLQQDLFGKLKQIQRQTGARSISEVVRYAVSQIDASELKRQMHRTAKFLSACLINSVNDW